MKHFGIRFSVKFLGKMIEYSKKVNGWKCKTVNSLFSVKITILFIYFIRKVPLELTKFHQTGR